MAAEARFRQMVADAGGTVVEPRWLGVMAPHRVRCAAGHLVTPRPNSVRTPGRFCRICAGQDPARAADAFRARVAALGGVVLEPSWLGNGQPHRVRCREGHECRPTPGNVSRGQGICPTCAGHHSEVTRHAFYARVAELGGEILEPSWLGVDRPHRVRCAQGHLSTPRPSGVVRGHGVCRACAGRDPVAAEARFRARIAELGGTVLEAGWRGNGKPHRVRCPRGHTTCVRPDHLASGNGMCRYCDGRAWDVFYLVADRTAHRLKFGITSGDPRPRLTDHAHDGYRETLLLLRGLPAGAALTMERAVRKALRQAGERPIRGHEHFDIGVEALVRDVVESMAGSYLEEGDCRS